MSGFGNTFVVSVLGALATHEMAIHFGAAGYGIFVTALAFGGIISNFTDLGLFPVLQRDIARDPSQASRLMGLVVGLRMTLTAIAVPIAIGVGYLIYRHHSSSLKVAIVLVLLSAPLLGLLQIMSAYFSATSRLPTVAVIGIVKQVTFVVLVIIVIVEHLSIVDCVGATLVGAFVATALSYVIVRREVHLRFAVDRREWKSMLVETTSVGFSSILGYFYLNADILILSVMVSSSQVGAYGVSYAVVSVFGAIPTLLSVAILPMIVHTTDDQLDGVINAAIKYFAIAGALMGTLGIVVGASVVRLYAGPHFDNAVLPLQILSSGQVALFMTQGLSSISIARGHHRKLFQCSLIGLITNVALNFALIPSFGIRGSAAATTLCELFLAFVMSRIIRKDLGVTPHVFRASWKAALAAVVPCVALWHWYAHGKASSIEGLVLAVPATALFVLVLFLLRGIPSEVMPIVRGWLRRGGEAS
jgi:O-antigen/teichoic acid export membrane protein